MPLDDAGHGLGQQFFNRANGGISVSVDGGGASRDLERARTCNCVMPDRLGGQGPLRKREGSAFIAKAGLAEYQTGDEQIVFWLLIEQRLQL